MWLLPSGVPPRGVMNSPLLTSRISAPGFAFGGDEPAGRRGQVLVGLVADLAGGHRRGRHVEQEGLARLAGGGEGDGVGAEAGLGAEGGGDLDAARRRRDHADQPGLDGHQGVETAGAEMRRVAHGGDADAGGLCLVDGELHGVPRIGMAETAAAIDQRGNQRFPHDGGLGAHVDPAGAAAFVVRRHHRDAVRVDAVQVGPAHDLRGAGGGFFGHAPGPQDEFELASMGRIGRGHLVFPGFDVAQGCGITLAPAIPRLTNSVIPLRATVRGAAASLAAGARR